MSLYDNASGSSLRLTLYAIVLSLFCAAGQFLDGQTATGNIVGRVTDSTDAIMPGVEVTAVNPRRV